MTSADDDIIESFTGNAEDDNNKNLLMRKFDGLATKT